MQQQQQREPVYAGTPKRRMEHHTPTVTVIKRPYHIQGSISGGGGVLRESPSPPTIKVGKSEPPNQIVNKRKIERNMSNVLKLGDVVRHLFNGHYEYAIFYSGIGWLTGEKTIEKNRLIPYNENDDPFEIIEDFDCDEDTAFRSLSGFAVSHKNTLDPTKTHQANGWKECEVQMPNGTWSSIARVYP
jgi:hypothetical protein